MMFFYVPNIIYYSSCNDKNNKNFDDKDIPNGSNTDAVRLLSAHVSQPTFFARSLLDDVALFDSHKLLLTSLFISTTASILTPPILRFNSSIPPIHIGIKQDTKLQNIVIKIG